MKEKYDLIFGIGEACSCTSALRAARLQFASYPFDWLYGTDFIGRCTILASKFNRFIKQSDLEDMHQTNQDTHNLCEIYHNKHNDLTFNHDFAFGYSLDKTYPTVYEKYMRRISRLLESVNKSHRVLVVYIETPFIGHEFVNDSMLIHGHEIIKRAFPNTEFDLLYFSNSINKKQTVKVSDNVTRVYDDYKDKSAKLDYVVLEKILVNHLQDFKLNVPLLVKIRRGMKRALINAIPIGKIRHNLQRKYHVK